MFGDEADKKIVLPVIKTIFSTCNEIKKLDDEKSKIFQSLRAIFYHEMSWDRCRS